MGNAVVVGGLVKRFGADGGLHALGPVDLELPAGSFTCVLGPTGCGKTTLLRTVADLEEPDAGHIEVAPVSGRPARLGYVFQQGALFPWMTVRANVEFPLRATGLAAGERSREAERVLGMVGLSGFEASYPHELSGGMQQRTALARSLVTSPDILLLDEPFSSLDTGTSEELQEGLRELWRRSGTTVLFVTHNIEEAVFLAGRIVVMGYRPGRVVRKVEVDLPEPRDRLSPRFTELLLSVRGTFERLVDPGDGGAGVQPDPAKPPHSRTNS